MSLVQQQKDGQPSTYIDPRYAQGPNNFDPSAIAQASQDPNSPAKPKHPNVSMSPLLRCLIKPEHC